MEVGLSVTARPVLHRSRQHGVPIDRRQHKILQLVISGDHTCEPFDDKIQIGPVVKPMAKKIVG